MPTHPAAAPVHTPTASSDRTFTLTIDGRPASGELTPLDVINPATEEVVVLTPSASPDQLDAAVTAARTAYPGWAAQPLGRRRAVVRRIADRIDENAAELARLLTTEQGKPLDNALAEVTRSAMWAREIADLPFEEEVLIDDDVRTVVLRRTPLGVVGAIVPWNFPVSLAVWKIAPALVTGNTIIVKPSPNTPLTGLLLGELLRDVVPPGVVQVLTGGDELGPWLTAHPGIDKIAFTGSTTTGKKVMAAASERLARVTLELGGNDPAIVLPDVDVPEVAAKLFWAAFANSGQYCLAAKRLYVHQEIFEEFAAAMAAVAKAAVVGDGLVDGTRLGPLQNRTQLDLVRSFVEESRERGDRIVVDVPVETERGYFLGPVVVADPPDDSRLVTEEPFGPVVPLLSWREDDDVVERANSSRYGLGASVWGADRERAEGLARRLASGVVWVNEVQVLLPQMPMGGHRESGIGRENGVEGLLEYTNTQSLSVRRG